MHERGPNEVDVFGYVGREAVSLVATKMFAAVIVRAVHIVIGVEYSFRFCCRGIKVYDVSARGEPETVGIQAKFAREP